MMTLKGNESEILQLREKAKAIQIIVGDVMRTNFDEEHLSEDGRVALITNYESIAVYLGIVLGYASDINRIISEAETDPVCGQQKRRSLVNGFNPMSPSEITDLV